jgi:hypothetical protein
MPDVRRLRPLSFLALALASAPSCYAFIPGGSGDDASAADDDGSFPANDDDSAAGGDDDDDATTSGPDDDDVTTPPPPPDGDGDGVPDSGDCAPDDPAIYPGAPDACDGVDQDCDGYPEQTPSGAAQEMFITFWGHLYVTILSVDAGCDIYLAMDAPVVIPDMVGEVHSAVGVEVDVGAVLPCSVMHFTSTSCANAFDTLDPAAFHVIQLGENHWRLEHEDGYDSDYNDVIFDALVEPREAE